MITYQPQDKGLFTFYKEQEQQLIDKPEAALKKPQKSKKKKRKNNKQSKHEKGSKVEKKHNNQTLPNEMSEIEGPELTNKFLKAVLEGGRRARKDRAEVLKKMDNQEEMQNNLRRIYDLQSNLIGQYQVRNVVLSKADTIDLSCQRRKQQQSDRVQQVSHDSKESTYYDMKRVYPDQSELSQELAPPEQQLRYPEFYQNKPIKHLYKRPRHQHLFNQTEEKAHKEAKDQEKISETLPISPPSEDTSKLPSIIGKIRRVKLEELKMSKIESISSNKNQPLLLISKEKPCHTTCLPKAERQRLIKPQRADKSVAGLARKAESHKELPQFSEQHLNRELQLGMQMNVDSHPILKYLDVGKEVYNDRSVNWSDRKRYFLKKLGINI